MRCQKTTYSYHAVRRALSVAATLIVASLFGLPANAQEPRTWRAELIWEFGN